MARCRAGLQGNDSSRVVAVLDANRTVSQVTRGPSGGRRRVADQDLLPVSRAAPWMPWGKGAGGGRCRLMLLPCRRLIRRRLPGGIRRRRTKWQHERQMYASAARFSRACWSSPCSCGEARLDSGAVICLWHPASMRMPPSVRSTANRNCGTDRPPACGHAGANQAAPSRRTASRRSAPCRGAAQVGVSVRSARPADPQGCAGRRRPLGFGALRTAPLGWARPLAPGRRRSGWLPLQVSAAQVIAPSRTAAMTASRRFRRIARGKARRRDHVSCIAALLPAGCRCGGMLGATLHSINGIAFTFRQKNPRGRGAMLGAVDAGFILKPDLPQCKVSPTLGPWRFR